MLRSSATSWLPLVTSAESTLAKVHQNKQLKLSLESTLNEKQGMGEGIQLTEIG
jgi:hypothetical protein